MGITNSALFEFNDILNEEYSLVGQDGNAFSLMGYTARCMKECGFKKADIDEMRERAMSSDYDNLIVVCDEYIQKCNKIANEDMYESCSNKDIMDEYFDIRLSDIDTAVKKTLEKFYYKLPHYEVKGTPNIGYHVTITMNSYDARDFTPSLMKKALKQFGKVTQRTSRPNAWGTVYYDGKVYEYWIEPQEDIVDEGYPIGGCPSGIPNEPVIPTEENAEPEIYNKPGEFWYFTKHGVGPGSVPKGITIEKTIYKDGGEYFLIKDKILSTYALNKYEIKEKSPEDVDEDWEKPNGNFAGWVAIYQGKKIEIPKNEANSLYDAKLKAIEKLKVPKSKVGLLVVQPGYNESLESNNKNVDDMSFDELLELWWEMNGQLGPVDMEMEPDEIDAYFKENPEELKYNVEQGLKWYE